MTSIPRIPVSASPNHQPATTRMVTTTTATNNLTRSFTVSAPTLTTSRTAANSSQQIIAAPTTARLTSTISQTTGIVVQPQIMVNTTKSVVHGANHMTTARPVQIHSANTGQKVSKQIFRKQKKYQC